MDNYFSAAILSSLQCQPLIKNLKLNLPAFFDRIELTLVVQFFIFNSSFLIYFVPAKKQPWASSLCHSRVPHTYVDL